MPVPSLFNILMPLCGSEDVLVFNTLKGSAATLPRQDALSLASGLSEAVGPLSMWRHYKAGRNSSGQEEPAEAAIHHPGASDRQEEETLLSLGILVESRASELHAVQEMLSSYWQPKTLKLTLSYTAACQMSCGYCFQSGRDLSLRHDSALAESTFSFIESYLDEHQEIESVHLGLFGGEPLTDLSLAELYIKRLGQITESRSQRLEISLTTNGLNLSDKLVLNWIPRGLRYLRVTLDGPPDIHDRRRPGISGQPTFERILHNLLALKDLKGFGIGVSINIDEQNADHIGQLLDILAEKGLKEDVEIILEPTLPAYGAAGQQPGETERLVALPDKQAQGKLLARCLSQVIERGFRTPLVPGLCAPCNFVQANNFVIDWSGQLFRCTFTMLCRELSVGTVGGGVTAKNEDMLEARKAILPCLEKQCAYLPVCLSGCRYEALLSTGDFKAENCLLPFFDQVLPLSICHAFALKPAEKNLLACPGI